MTTLYDDTYTGPRWRYGLQHRPISNYFIGRGDGPHTWPELWGSCSLSLTTADAHRR